MSAARRIERRTILKGLGAALGLPLLDAMAPVAQASLPGAQTPLRMGFFFVPNGVHMPAWKPEQSGAEFALPHILEPLAAHRDDLLVISGLAHDKGRANGDGPGDHARSLASFLTASQPYKTAGANLRAGISVDQVAAQQVGHRTPLASLELGCDRGAQSGNCDSGYSCAYSSNVSWRSPTQPAGKEINPRLVFERLFGDDRLNESADARARRQKYQQSVLDFVRDDAARLNTRLSQNDRRKLDEYFTSIREIERRIVRAETLPADAPRSGQATIERPGGIPEEYQEHLRLMFDLLALAYQTDQTRISTFMFANEGSNRSYAFLEVPEGHHDLSHHGGDEAKQTKIQAINRFHMEQFAYFVERLKNTPEGEGNLLDHSLLLYGAGIGDGNRHNHDDLPVALLGRAGGAVAPGRHLLLEKETPMANLFLSMLDLMDVRIDQFGDSTGRLTGLA